MNRYFSGTGSLVRFILRRDRIRLLAWVLGIVLFTVALAPVFDGMFGTEGERLVMAETMLNPAMVALVGPVYGIQDYHVGAMFSNMMLAFMCLFAGIMNIFLVARHTRNDEEQGRLEVIRSLPVGRLSNLGATLITALGVDILIAVLSGMGLSLFHYSGMTVQGSMLFGAAMGVCGFLFAAATAVFCQMTANNRTASGLSILFLAVLYMMRAVGDMGTEIVSLISPLGLVLRSEVYVENLWWPVAVVLATALGIAVLAFVLARIRDLGRGLVPEKPGKKHASGLLSSPLGLALRLSRTSIIVWTAAIFLFAAMYASIFGDLENFIANNAMLSAIFPEGSEFSFAEQFIGLLMIIMSVISTIPVLLLMLRVRSEEKQGHTEHLLSKSVSRTSQFASYFGMAFVMSVVLQMLTALGFWAVGSASMGTTLNLSSFVQSALVYLPAIWVMLGLASALVGWIPSQSGLVYGYLGLGFFLVYIGAVAQLPDWTSKLSPYGHVSRLPIEELEILPLIVMSILSAAFIILGIVGYRKRDVATA